MINYERILKDCFWDYNFTHDEIKKLATSENLRENSFLFQKILLNSTNMLNSLKIFDIDRLKRLIVEYKVPTFNQKYIFKRKNIAEAYFLDKPILVNELKWMV